MAICVLIMRPIPIFTLFPYTTLFRSRYVHSASVGVAAGLDRDAVVADVEGHVVDQYVVAALRVAAIGVRAGGVDCDTLRSEEHTSELQSPAQPVCRLLLEKKKNKEGL